MRASSDSPAAGGPSVVALWRREERRKRRISYLLIAPMLLVMVLALVIPFVFTVINSVDNREVREILPSLSLEMRGWDGNGIEERHYLALARDLVAASENRVVNRLARRLNAQMFGFQAMLLKTARDLAKDPVSEGTAAARFSRIDPRWQDVGTWHLLEGALKPVNLSYYLAAFDLTVSGDGSVVSVPDDRKVFRSVWLHTIWTSLAITLICVLIAYPAAYGIASARPSVEIAALALVVLTFWTSLLVRTTAWVALLQSEGLVNKLLKWLGVIDQPLTLIHNRVGVYIAMIQILLPFMILSLYGSMKRMPRNVIRASQSLGAGAVQTFFRVYLPLTYSGLGAGAIIVFVMAAGFYVTPAIVGGVEDQMISYYIYYYANESLNWGMASAISILLFVFTATLFAFLLRRFGVDAVRMR